MSSAAVPLTRAQMLEVLQQRLQQQQQRQPAVAADESPPPPLPPAPQPDLSIRVQSGDDSRADTVGLYNNWGRSSSAVSATDLPSSPAYSRLDSAPGSGTATPAVPPLPVRPSTDAVSPDRLSSAKTREPVAEAAGGMDGGARLRLSGGYQGQVGVPFSVLQFDSRGNVVVPVVSASNAPIALGVWAYYLALASAALCIFFGPLSIVWFAYSTSPLYTDKFNIGAGIYSICVGCIMLYEELLGLPLRRGLSRFFDTMASRYNLRSLLYCGLSGVLFLSYPTVIPAVALLCTAAVNRIACAEGERFLQNLQAKQKRPAAATASEQADGKGGCGCCAKVWGVVLPMWEFVVHVRHRNALGIVFWLSLYAAGNILLFVFSLRTWIHRASNSIDAAEAASLPHDQALSYWIAPAKAFGILLDLNCALILLPVCRTLIRWLYVQSTKDRAWTTLALRYALKLAPLDYHVHFHRVIAAVVLVAAIGHTFAHFINFALRPSFTISILGGPWPLISGGLLVVVVLLMYTAALPRVRAARFELFFEVHHLFIFFFVLLLVHGAHGEGPNFWKYFIGPAAVYIADRLLRIRQGRRAAELRSVQFMQDVMCLEFGKTGVFAKSYKPGQYLTLQCPAISPLQWHPFTISSAPGDPTVTIHVKIRVDNPGSFTYRVAAYLSSLQRDRLLQQAQTSGALTVGDGTSSLMSDWGRIQFERENPMLGHPPLPGRCDGPDGRPLFRIAGPFSAPTQHLTEYKVAMVVGAGIGVTPLSACMREVVLYDWYRRTGGDYPNHVFFVWLVSHAELDGFRWMLRLVRKTQQKINALRALGGMRDHTFELCVYVTSPPRDTAQREADAVRMLQEMKARDVLKDRVMHQAAQHDAALHSEAQHEVGDALMQWDDYKLALNCLVAKRKALDADGKWATSHQASADAATAAATSGAGARSGQLDNVRIYTGRPDWNDAFSALAQRFPAEQIGVVFCGPPAIADDLREQSWRQNARKGGAAKFVVHSENF